MATAPARPRETQEALASATARIAARRRWLEVADAGRRYAELMTLEAECDAARTLGGTLLSPNVLNALGAKERAVNKARAAVDAGATWLEFIGDVSGLTVDGVGVEPGAGRSRVRHAFVLGAAALIVRPPVGAQSAETELAHATEDLATALPVAGRA